MHYVYTLNALHELNFSVSLLFFDQNKKISKNPTQNETVKRPYHVTCFYN
jgi:hypothetical protein